MVIGGLKYFAMHIATVMLSTITAILVLRPVQLQSVRFAQSANIVFTEACNVFQQL